jgi:hypothetical protein
MLPVLSCGVFKWELEKILPEIEQELGEKITPKFLPPALDESESKLEAALKEGVADFNSQDSNPNCAFLYGSMCHTAMEALSKELGSVYPAPANCAALLMGPEKKKEMDAMGNFYYLTSYGLREWRSVYKEGGHSWDEADARVNFSYFEKIIVLDTGVIEINDEELFEFFDYTQVPVEAEKISLDYFKSVVLDMCKKLATASTRSN